MTRAVGAISPERAVRRAPGGLHRRVPDGTDRLYPAAEPLLVRDPAEHGPHPGALVEAEGAGGALGVHAEPDAALAALPEARERVGEERRADAALAPWAAREEHVHEAAPVRVARADRPGGDLVAGAHDAPQRRVEALALEIDHPPRREVARDVVPGVRERLLLRGEELAHVTLGVELDDAQAARPRGRRRRRLELDAHLAEHAHGGVAERLEQRAGGGGGLQHAV